MIRSEWKKTPLLTLQKLVKSMPNCLAAVLESKGATTAY